MSGRTVRTRVWLWALATALVLGPAAPAAPAAAQSGPLRGLDAYIEKGLADWEIPGFAIAVVHRDSVVYARGYGVRELGRPDRVDANTLFAIGSASKAFTAAAIAILVDEGRVEWDDPATDHLPGFQLFDPFATRELTVRDLLSHRSGLSRGDLLWYASELDRDEILERTRHLEPSWGFRSQFGYQNLMYLAAGQIVPATAGRSWDDFVRDRLFAPLGMTRSVTSTLPLAGMRNVASPHAEVDGTVRPIAWRNIDNIAPAGSINSSVNEMAQWVRLQLGKGEYGGRRILSEDVVAEMHSPVTLVRREGGWATMSPASHFMAYGMGWFLNDHLGRLVVQHGGNIDGMHALVGMMPEEDLGVVILTNRNPNSLSYAVMYRVFERYMGETPTDWSARMLARTDTLRTRAEERRREVEGGRIAGTRHSLGLDAYTGTYRHAMYGDAVVRLQTGALVLTRGPSFTADLEHWHFDTFRARWRDRTMGEAFVGFTLDARGRVARLEIQGVGRFERVPDAAASADGQEGGR